MDGVALHSEGRAQGQEPKYWVYSLVLFSVAFGNVFNLVLSPVRLSIIVIMSSDIHKNWFEFIKACRKSGVA